MAGLVKRPPASLKGGLLDQEHFQICHCTNDLERACAVFADRFGIEEWRRLEGDLPSGGYIRIAIAWAGGVMYELLTASGPGTDFYMDRLPKDDFAMRLHHLGYLVHDQAGWDAMKAEVTRGGWRISQENNTVGFMRHCYVEAPELGHYLEYIFPEAAGIAFFEAVPAH